MIVLICILSVLILYIIIGIIVIFALLAKNKKIAKKYSSNVNQKTYTYKSEKPNGSSILLIENTELNGFSIMPLISHLTSLGYDVILFNQRWVSFSPNKARDYIKNYVEENDLKRLILMSFGTGAILHQLVSKVIEDRVIKNVYIAPVHSLYIGVNISKFAKTIFYLIAKSIIACVAKSDIHFLSFENEPKNTLVLWSAKDKLYMNYLVVCCTQHKASKKVKYIGYPKEGYHLYLEKDSSLQKDYFYKQNLKGKEEVQTLEIPPINEEFSEDLLNFLNK